MKLNDAQDTVIAVRNINSFSIIPNQWLRVKFAHGKQDEDYFYRTTEMLMKDVERLSDAIERLDGKEREYGVNVRD